MARCCPTRTARRCAWWCRGSTASSRPSRSCSIRFVDKQPKTSWESAAASEYGFYSNVNPKVDHPRWSQATERRIGDDGLLSKKRPTLMFNGYEAQVGQLYAGMDLAQVLLIRARRTGAPACAP